MNEKFVNRIASELEEINIAGLMKKERIITSTQDAAITVGGKTVQNPAYQSSSVGDARWIFVSCFTNDTRRCRNH